MQVIVVRHGESEANQQGVIQGRLDSRITDRGHRQVIALGAALADYSVSHIYTSPASRAISTARVLANQFSCLLTCDERLHERHFGVLQGMQFAQTLREYPGMAERLLSGSPQAAIPGGETVFDVSNRLLSFLKELPGKHEDKTVIIVSHGHALEILIWKLKGGAFDDDLRKYGHQNAAYSVLNIGGEAIELTSWGRATHLKNTG
ncbi:histidine phosphatase family protein [Cedecea davisae]|uniref:histidine phosphatase family protein n=1 Tax=Cedecea davisae TaxID=158484 RepID=UPI001D0A830D|nr:histidine phosphatase family protein [Cedecea davisae]